MLLKEVFFMGLELILRSLQANLFIFTQAYQTDQRPVHQVFVLMFRLTWYLKQAIASHYFRILHLLHALQRYRLPLICGAKIVHEENSYSLLQTSFQNVIPNTIALYLQGRVFWQPAPWKDWYIWDFEMLRQKQALGQASRI